MVEFADSNPNVAAVYNGIDMENFYEGDGKSVVYYFLMQKPKCDSRLSDLVTELDIKIYLETGHECDFMCLPNLGRGARDYEFLEEEDCIYDSDKR